MPLETLIYLAGLILTVGAIGGLGVIGVGELRVRSQRRSRLSGGGTVTGGAMETPGGAIGGQLLATVRRLGQQSAVRDPGQGFGLALPPDAGRVLRP